MKLSPDLQISISVAINEAANRGHEYVTLEHLLFALLHDSECATTIRQCGGDIKELKKLLDRYLAEKVEQLPEERRGAPQPTVAFQRVLARAANHVEGAGRDQVAGSNVLVAMYAEPESWAVHYLKKQGISRLDIVSYISHGVSKRDAGMTTPMPAGDGVDPDEEGDEPKGDPLEAFTSNLAKRAADGTIDPLIGRAKEIQRLLHILARRRKNNPLLLGDSGVGKTALIEGLALKIHEGDVPEMLSGAVIYALDMGALLAGTRYRGDFENRMKAVFKALDSQENAILFIDELHTVIGAGAASGGTLDASNLLKPALAQGTLRCIGSSTHEEFRQHLERDRALMRRFQQIVVDEPSVDETTKILEGLRSRYEEFHDITYTKTALRTAAEMSHRYLHERRLPDKAIDVLDEAGAAARLAGRSGGRISAREVENILSTMAQIPPKRVSRSDRDRLLALEDELKEVVFGQDAALDALCSAVKMSRAGLGAPERPVGSFLLTGPTGVGKTETAKQLAATMGLEFIRFDMSEYMERHTVSRLIGAPPGYVGFDQGGLLTDAIRKTPHAVLLLDEIEKAHPDVFNLLLQVMDHGSLTDNNGKRADFRHVILLMTSNVGSRELEKRQVGFGGSGDARGNEDEEYRRVFSPEFRNRLDARISFSSLSPEVMLLIVDKFIKELSGQLTARKVTIELDDDARALFAKEGFDPKFGARPLGRVLQDRLKRPLSNEVLFGKLEHGGKVTVRVADGELVIDCVGRQAPARSEEEDEDTDNAPEEKQASDVSTADPEAASPDQRADR